MSTNFYIRKAGSEEEGLHVCLRTAGTLIFQAVYPSRRFTDLAGQTSWAYFYAEDFKEILPADVQAITSAEDWVYVLENLPEGVELYNDNEYPVTAIELANTITTSTPQPLAEYCEMFEKEIEESTLSEDFFHALNRDDLVDRKGWRLSYRSFS